MEAWLFYPSAPDKSMVVDNLMHNLKMERFYKPQIAFFNAKDQRVEGSRKITLIEDLSPFEPSTL
jgi:hypothetical protein